MLKRLSADLVVQICPWLILQTLRMSPVTDNNIEDQLEFISAVALCHEIAKESNPPGMTHIEELHSPRDLPLSLEELKNRFLLKVCILNMSFCGWMTSNTCFFIYKFYWSVFYRETSEETCLLLRWEVLHTAT